MSQPTGTGFPRGAAPGPNTTGTRGAKNKGTVTITLDELDRIRAQVHKTNTDEYTTMRNCARAELQQTSKARVQNWPNTMEALRLKREEDRIKRLEDEEVRNTTQDQHI